MSNSKPPTPTDTLDPVFEGVGLPVVKYEIQPQEESVDVVYKNTAFDEVLEQPTKKQPDYRIHQTDGGVDQGVDLQQTNHLVETEQVVVEVICETGRKRYLCNKIEIEVGVFVEIYHDITKEKQQRKYIDVLHRVLRHNLRNDLNVILGHSEILVDELSEGSVAHDSAQQIHETASKLVSLAEETRTIRGVINDTDELIEVNLDKKITSSIEKYGDREDTQIDYTKSTSQPVLGNTRLQSLVSALVSNAVEHNTGERRVDISLEPRAGGECVALSVGDNGVGIRNQHKDILTGDKTITSLEHNDGLGLWVIRWVADKCGAEIRVIDRQSPGTEIEVIFQTPHQSG